MNSPLKRVALACILMFGLLMLNVNYLQAVRAEGIREDSRNFRNFYARYEVQRGRITAGNKVLAESVETGDNTFKYARRYPEGKVYAPITGFFAPESTRDIERAKNNLLDGSSADLLIRRSIDLFSGTQTKGANVDLTINPKAQEAAYKALSESGKKGALVAIEPKTGAILAMVSVPTYDPNPLSKADKAGVNKAYEKLAEDEDQPLLNRAIERTYPPGSTFKVVTMAAYLESDDTLGPQSQIDAPTRLDLPNTTHDLPNHGNSACGNGRVTLSYALEKSCNTPFGKIGMDLGYDAMKEQAARFGIGGEQLEIPMPVSASSIGDEEDQAALAQASIGQRNNQMTPLQMAMVAAGVANNGVVMKPYLVNKVADAEGGEVETADPEELSTAMSEETAAKLKEMMVNVVNLGTASAAQIPGVTVAGKTGTAETSGNRAPHAWFVSFAPAEDPKVAVALIVESGSAGNDASGGQTAAPIARSVMEAVLGR
ncbi:peptidoglycan D,D-transpeptidase FtsI family protein [Planomonospora parontospora]|uniref:peptidoglycan D,D-transpeptidase FtsI family protein n=1 Tax=Planomonospora parontospora TaxID=58119 RepID=UPI001670F444|nr:penicillin-binding transpeptidase domain-containing protein [Planomonospora parontospora]GGL34082.1 penicillin-binding protein A [Planomonospora parontospora subsp. antibiotica]GII17098.1 penicillin-binding protein A [Planomonospora parontospora subsp. antibiotica]